MEEYIHIAAVECSVVYDFRPQFGFCLEVQICQCYSMNKPSARISKLIGW